MKKLVPSAAASLALLGAAPVALAATQIGEYLSFSGFGTLGAVRTNSDEGKLGRDGQTGGADKEASVDVDSNLGLQVTGTATPWLSATVQALAAKRNKDHIEAQVEWAFVTVKPLDGLSLRGGRMAAPLFAVSDSRNVGYANTWVRAPNEVYALNPFSKMDAVDATYRKSLGSMAITATGFLGKTDFKVGGVDATGDNLKGLNLQVETDWAAFRLGRATADVSVPDLGVKDDRYTFTGFGVTVDRDNIVAQAESVRRRSAGSPTVVNADAWYVMGGYRLGAMLPYVIVSSTKPKTPDSPNLVSAEQKTTALGIRWDAFGSTSFKFQIDRIDTNGTRGISFTTPSTPAPSPGAPPGLASLSKPVTALSVAVDFVF